MGDDDGNNSKHHPRKVVTASGGAPANRRRTSDVEDDNGASQPAVPPRSNQTAATLGTPPQGQDEDLESQVSWRGNKSERVSAMMAADEAFARELQAQEDMRNHSQPVGGKKISMARREKRRKLSAHGTDNTMADTTVNDSAPTVPPAVASTIQAEEDGSQALPQQQELGQVPQQDGSQALVQQQVSASQDQGQVPGAFAVQQGVVVQRTLRGIPQGDDLETPISEPAENEAEQVVSDLPIAAVVVNTPPPAENSSPVVTQDMLRVMLTRELQQAVRAEVIPPEQTNVPNGDDAGDQEPNGHHGSETELNASQEPRKKIWQRPYVWVLCAVALVGLIVGVSVAVSSQGGGGSSESVPSNAAPTVPVTMSPTDPVAPATPEPTPAPDSSESVPSSAAPTVPVTMSPTDPVAPATPEPTPAPRPAATPYPTPPQTPPPSPFPTPSSPTDPVAPATPEPTPAPKPVATPYPTPYPTPFPTPPPPTPIPTPAPSTPFPTPPPTREVFSVPGGELGNNNAVQISPDDDVLYVTRSDGTLDGLDPITGRPLFPSIDPNTFAIGGSFACHGGVSFYTGNDAYAVYSVVGDAGISYVVAVSHPNGAILWAAERAGEAEGTPLISNDGAYVYVIHNLGSSGWFSILDATDEGAEFWTKENANFTYSPPAIQHTPPYGNFPPNFDGTNNQNDLLMWASTTSPFTNGGGETFAFQLPLGFTTGDTHDGLGISFLSQTSWQTQNKPAFANDGTEVFFGISKNQFRGWVAHGTPGNPKGRFHASATAAAEDRWGRGDPNFVDPATAPVVNSDSTVLFCGMATPFFVALLADTPTLDTRWEVGTQSIVLTDPVLSEDESVVFWAESNPAVLHATIVESTGEDLWTQGLAAGAGNGISAEMSLSNDGTIIYFGQNSGQVTAWRV